MPKLYDEGTWSGQQPSDVLQDLLAMFLGSTSSGNTSDVLLAAEKKDAKLADSSRGAVKDAPTFSHAITVTVQDMTVVGQAQRSESGAAAEQAAALDAVHKCAPLVQWNISLLMLAGTPKNTTVYDMSCTCFRTLLLVRTGMLQ